MCCLLSKEPPPPRPHGTSERYIITLHITIYLYIPITKDILHQMLRTIKRFYFVITKYCYQRICNPSKHIYNFPAR